MNKQKKYMNDFVKIIILYLLLFFIGVLFSFWLGLGWFFLFHTISVLIASSPRLYMIVLKPFLNNDTYERFYEYDFVKKKQWFFPKSAIVINIINIVITIFAFWKINLPLIIAIRAIFY